MNEFAFTMLYIRKEFYKDHSNILRFENLIGFKKLDNLKYRMIELKGEENYLKVKQYIEEHFLESISLSDLEEKFNLNKFNLIRQFKKRFNTIPSGLQLQLKVDLAKQLLDKKGDMLDIALEAGFYDQSHFIRELKEVYGISPLQYYKEINE